MKKQRLIHPSPSACLRPSSVIVLGLLALVGIGLAPGRLFAAGPPYQLQVVAYLGDPAPGGGAFVHGFEPTGLNNRGQLAFTAEPETPGKRAIFVAGSDSLSEIVRFGQSAPGGGVFGTSKSGDIGLNDPGDMAFGFDLEDESQSVFRWSHQHQTLSAVVVPNVTPVPDGSGVFVGAFGYPSINNQADIAFLGNVTNPPPTSFTFVPYRTGIFVGDRFGDIRIVVKPGDPAPGGGTFISAGSMYGTIFGFLFTIVTIGVDINDGGDVAFPAQISTAPNNFTPYVRRFATGAIEAIPPAPGVPTGFVDRVSINNQGDLAFLASRDLATYLFSNAAVGAVCLSSGGTTVSVVALNDPAPQGGHFTKLGKGLAFNNRGDLAFAARTDTQDQAMYLYSRANGKSRRIAGTGTVVPGEGVIANLVQLDFNELNAALNDHGQIAFVANVSDGSASRTALIVATPGNGAK